MILVEPRRIRTIDYLPKMVVNRITIPTYEINSAPRVRYADIQTRRYRVLDRTRERTAIETGEIGQIFGVTMITSEPTYVGSMPIRSDVKIMGSRPAIKTRVEIRILR